MDLNPQAVADAQFRIVRKGYDPEQVRPLLAQAAESLRAVESRAQAAESKVSSAEARATDAERRSIEAEARAKAALQAASAVQEGAEDPDRLRRAILTAQKAADTLVADATAEAETIRTAAKDEAKKITTDARAAAARMVADAEQAARAAHSAEIERTKADMAELNTLRDQLRSDADFLSAHLVGQRQRVTDSVAALQAVLDNPTALRPMPVPETTPVAEGDAPTTAPSGGGGYRGGGNVSADAPGAATEPRARALTADDPTADDRPAADGVDDDVAGELASFVGDDTAPESRADPADAFFGQSEPFSDDRWKQGS
jgi:cell division septum initiation protein DivIVA